MDEELVAEGVGGIEEGFGFGGGEDVGEGSRQAWPGDAVEEGLTGELIEQGAKDGDVHGDPVSGRAGPGKTVEISVDILAGDGCWWFGGLLGEGAEDLAVVEEGGAGIAALLEGGGGVAPEGRPVGPGTLQGEYGACCGKRTASGQKRYGSGTITALHGVEPGVFRLVICDSEGTGMLRIMRNKVC